MLWKKKRADNFCGEENLDVMEELSLIWTVNDLIVYSKTV